MYNTGCLMYFIVHSKTTHNGNSIIVNITNKHFNNKRGVQMLNIQRNLYKNICKLVNNMHKLETLVRQ